nr:4'-phosphopantetheinyl transferase superfamily protein [uncultured Aminipila sp.]
MVLYVHNGKEQKGIAGEELVKKALADYSNKIYDAALIKCGKHGKPYFENIPVCFSISHSGEIWVCLMADFNVGMDIQIYKQLKYEKVAQRFFQENEVKYINEQGIDAFFQVWVRKEAYVKYTGNGFANEGFSNFSVVNKENEGYFFESNIEEAYFQEIDLELDKLNINVEEKFVGVACTQLKEPIVIKRI